MGKRTISLECARTKKFWNQKEHALNVVCLVIQQRVVNVKEMNQIQMMNEDVWVIK